MKPTELLALKRHLSRVCRVSAERLMHATEDELLAMANELAVAVEVYRATPHAAAPTPSTAAPPSSSTAPPPPPVTTAAVPLRRNPAHLISLPDDVYVGERNLAGQREGRGTLKLANGSVYEGEWVADAYEGRGRYTDARGDAYEGEFKAGVMSGHGLYCFANGDVYEGAYRHGLMDGRGVYRERASGEVHDGEYRAGNKHGRGLRTFASGEAMLAWFDADEPLGEGVVWSADRKEVWRTMNGEPVDAITQAEADQVAERVDQRG